MADIILHHYQGSPFSELLRLALGHKQLAWKSVIIPNIAPKPDLTPLTGGYRKTPVLQIGADIYCDTAIAIEAIETFKPEPTLFPAPLGRAGAFVGLWAGGPMFMHMVCTAMGPVLDFIPDAFWADRKALFGFDKERVRSALPHLKAQFEASLARAEDALADGRSFFGGDAPGYADFAFFMDTWFQMRADFGQPDAPVLNPFPHVRAWHGRVAAIGHGQSTEISAQDALDIAKASTASVTGLVEPDTGFAAGQQVTVRTEDPGADPVAGALIRLTSRDIAVMRDDPKVGTVCVHFPRLGQLVLPA